MKKTIFIIISFIYTTIGYSAVGDKFIAKTEEGVSVKYTILSEPPSSNISGTVSVYSCSVDGQTTEDVITIPQIVKNGSKRYKVTIIAGGAFGSCSLVTSIILPNSITEIGEYAFSGCEMLSNIILPDDLTAIGKGAFSNCKSLEAIAFPEGIKYIEENTFSNCVKLKDVLFNNVCIIYKYAFSGCTSLESLTFNQRMGIHSYAFNNCSSLNAVTFLDSELIWIQNYAFKECVNLKSVYSHITNVVAGIYDYSFYGINPDAILYVESEMKTEYENNYSWSRYFSSIRKFPLKLGDIISIDLFNSDISLNVTAEVINTVPMSLCINSLVDVAQTETIKDLIIPSHLIAYDDIFFLIDKIGANAFNQARMSSLTIEDGVKSIEEGAFGECYSLVSVTIPNSVTNIENAFSGCTNLNSVIVNWRKPSEVTINARCFDDIPNGAILYVPAGTKGLYEEHEVWSKFSEIVESGPLSVGDIMACNGSQVLLPILLRNDEPILGFQFRLTLPDGIEAAEADGAVQIETTERSNGFLVMGRKDGDKPNSYIFVGLSLSGQTIVGNEGAILNIILNVDDEMSIGLYEIRMDDINLVTSTYDTCLPTETWGELTIQDYVLGDVNGNGGIDIGDAVTIVNHMVGKHTANYIEKAADTNGNGTAGDIGDAVTIVNYLVGKPSPLSSSVKPWNDNEPQ